MDFGRELVYNAPVTRQSGAMHVVTTRRQYEDRVYETHLLRRSYREAGKVKNETLGNLSHLPPETIALSRESLAGKTHVEAGADWEIERSLPHGHVAAAWAMADKLGVAKLLGPPCRGGWPAGPTPARRRGGPGPASPDPRRQGAL